MEHLNFCRVCHNNCPVIATMEDGRPAEVRGDPSNPIWAGYTCIKGRSAPQIHYAADRLLTSLKRTSADTFRPIPAKHLMDEVAERIDTTVRKHGADAIASYLGTHIGDSPSSGPTLVALLNALGTSRRFTPETIDQAGKRVARALHGTWRAPAQGFDDPKCAVIFGINPLVSYQGGLPFGNSGRTLRRWLDNGMTLVVVDPRRSDLAKRATIHLQARPGTDAAIGACFVQVILTEQLIDTTFVREHVSGVATLQSSVAPFTPAAVASYADVDADELVRAARMFASAPRGYVAAGTGPNMAGNGTLLEYLVLCLNTLCGRWLRAGQTVRAPLTLAPQPEPVAEASAPTSPFPAGASLPGSVYRVPVAGPPVAGAADAILSTEDTRVRVLLSTGGNPAVSWPDQHKTVQALRALDLLVHSDIRLSETAQLADYVVAMKTGLEMPGYTFVGEQLASYADPYAGFQEPWAQYGPAVVPPPDESDLLEHWELFYGLAQRLGLPLELPGAPSVEPYVFDMCAILPPLRSYSTPARAADEFRSMRWSRHLTVPCSRAPLPSRPPGRPEGRNDWTWRTS